MGKNMFEMSSGNLLAQVLVKFPGTFVLSMLFNQKQPHFEIRHMLKIVMLQKTLARD